MADRQVCNTLKLIFRHGVRTLRMSDLERQVQTDHRDADPARAKRTRTRLSSEDPERDSRHAPTNREHLTAQADDSPRTDRCAEAFQRGKTSGGIRPRAGGFLDFDWVNLAVLHDEQVDLAAFLVAVVKKLRLLSAVPPALEHLAEHVGFENRAVHRSRFERLRRGPFRQVGAQSRIQEIELRRFHQPLGQVRYNRMLWMV